MKISVCFYDESFYISAQRIHTHTAHKHTAHTHKGTFSSQKKRKNQSKK